LPIRAEPRRSAIGDGYLIAWVLVGAALGATAGSFINCARYRLPRRISLNRPAHSYCASCGARLTAVDLVPVLSWLWLGGRCRRCHTPIGIGTLVIEAVCAAIGALVFVWLSGLIE
jgi:leader peptidase (prepilin peptidase) / N-methyltransferase